jgi:capsular exopolysaccharide synthesis family protein
MGAWTSLGALRRRWRLVVAVTLVGLLAAGAYAVLAPRSYRATASIFFSLQYGQSASDLVQGSTYTQDQVASFARLATTPVVLQQVIDDLDLSERPTALAGRIEASAAVQTVIVDVSATDPTAAGSARLANDVARRLSGTVEQLAPRDSAGSPTVRATTVASAEVPDKAASPRTVLDVVAGLIIGLLLGLVLAWCREALDNRVRDAEIVAVVTDLPVVGTIAHRSRRERHPVVIESEPHSPQAEFFRQLATNLQFLAVPGEAADDGGMRTVMVTSSLAAEGKTTVAANLAAALAETGRVVLVDADLRRPAVAELLGLEGAVGLSTALIGRASVMDVVQDWGTAGLHVLPSGLVPPNASELLNSPAMRRVLEELRRHYDYVILDAAPLLPVADAVILSRAVDGALVVANVTKVRRHQLAHSVGSLAQVKARVLGVVLNQVQRNDPAYGYEAHSWTASTPFPAAPVAGGAGVPAGRGAESGAGPIPERPAVPAAMRQDKVLRRGGSRR